MKLSIITINYNNKTGLQNTINSVLAQSWRDFEWIIVDGGSTDGSKELIENTTKDANSHITFWCSESDKGIYNAMNKGIAQANGEYCMFLNSGDCLFDSKSLQKVPFDSHDEDILICDVVDIVNGNYRKLLSMDNRVLTFDNLLCYSIPHPSSLIRRKLFSSVGTYDESYKIVADWKFFIDAILYHEASYVHIPLTLVLFEGNGISNEREDLHQEERRRVHKQYYPKCVQQDYFTFRAHEKYLNEIKSNVFTHWLLKIIHRIAITF